MPAKNRLTITLDEELYRRLVEMTERNKPRLTKRSVVELALERLFRDLDGGQLNLGLTINGRKT